MLPCIHLYCYTVVLAYTPYYIVDGYPSPLHRDIAHTKVWAIKERGLSPMSYMVGHYPLLGSERSHDDTESTTNHGHGHNHHHGEDGQENNAERDH